MSSDKLERRQAQYLFDNCLHLHRESARGMSIRSNTHSNVIGPIRHIFRQAVGSSGLDHLPKIGFLGSTELNECVASSFTCQN